MFTHCLAFSVPDLADAFPGRMSGSCFSAQSPWYSTAIPWSLSRTRRAHPARPAMPLPLRSRPQLLLGRVCLCPVRRHLGLALAWAAKSDLLLYLLRRHLREQRVRLRRLLPLGKAGDRMTSGRCWDEVATPPPITQASVLAHSIHGRLTTHFHSMFLPQCTISVSKNISIPEAP